MNNQHCSINIKKEQIVYKNVVSQQSTSESGLWLLAHGENHDYKNRYFEVKIHSIDKVKEVSKYWYYNWWL